MACPSDTKHVKLSSSPEKIDDDSAASVGSPGKSCAPLGGFWSLPEEVKLLIIALACSLSPAAQSNFIATDVVTARTLAVTSRLFHAPATSKLWTAIRITQTSSFIKLQQAIASRPELGRRIRSLHVGPDDELVEVHYPHRWPESTRDTPILSQSRAPYISTSLRSPDEARLLPKWCSPGQEWRLIRPRDCDAGVFSYRSLDPVSRALIAIEDGLEIDLAAMYPKWSLAELYEAQAALDLYLMELRRLDDARQGAPNKDDGASTSYPPLIVCENRDEAVEAQPSSASESFVLTRQDLRNHITRPGAVTNRFDYPAFFRRSGFDPGHPKAYGRGIARWQPSQRYDALSHRVEGHYMTGTDMRHSKTGFNPLEVLKSLLTMTPALQNLSLTGLFERILNGNYPQELGSVRYLSVGPPPRLRFWTATALLVHSFSGVEKLHLCGFIPNAEYVLTIGSLDQLQEMRWTLTDELVDEEILFLGVFLDALVGRRGTAADTAAASALAAASAGSAAGAATADEVLGFRGLNRLRLSSSPPAAQEPPSSRSEDEVVQSGPSRLVEVRLRPAQQAAMLDRAASEEERTAWATGRAFDGQNRRLLLAEIPLASLVVRKLGNVMTHALYEEGKIWWQEHCTSTGRSD